MSRQKGKQPYSFFHLQTLSFGLPQQIVTVERVCHVNLVTSPMVALPGGKAAWASGP